MIKTISYLIQLYLDVKESVHECVGGAELQKRKSQIQSYSEQTSSALKKHVYANYMQFIETAKEISRKNLIANRFYLCQYNFILNKHYFDKFHRSRVGNVSIISFTH